MAMAFKTRASSKDKTLNVPQAYVADEELPIGVDYSFLELNCLPDFLKDEPRNLQIVSSDIEKNAFTVDLKKTDTQYSVVILKLENNKFSKFPDFNEQFWKSIPTSISFTNLKWLDLSFNNIVNIEASISSLSNLEILYLHGNCIEKLNEIEKFSKLTRLLSLTCHGNPFQNIHIYRYFIINRIKSLKKLDFSLITRQERNEANLAKFKDRKNNKTIQ